ncbi:MAG: DEAD/DEAH box helicase family protein [Melioribacteraceae bacterium]|nr:DEAD/DEAH box helicase family protein [Melioribacteraceae bacterium]
MKLSLKDNLAYEIHEEIEIDKHIYSRKNKVIEYLKDHHKYYAFIAATNSGKTYSLLKICVEENIPVVFVVPLKMLNEQKFKEIMDFAAGKVFIIRSSDNINGINATTLEQINEAIKNGANIILCVYDSLNKLFMSKEFNPNQYILAIDESHNLVSQLDFRKETAVKVIYQKENLFRKIIYVTATPEIALPDFWYDLRIIKFKPTEDVILPEYKISIVDYSNMLNYGKRDFLRDKVYFSLNLIINRLKNDKQVFFFYDDFKVLKKLSYLVLKFTDNRPENILLLSSETKGDKGYQFIVENEKFEPYRKLILSTRLISDGINIKESLASLIILDLSDYLLKRQLIGRFRNGVDEIIDLHFSISENIGEIPSRKEIIQENIEYSKNYLKLLSGKARRLKTNFVQDPLQHIEYFNENGELKEFWPSYAQNYLKIFNRYVHNNINLLHEYYKDICNYSTEFSELKSDDFDIGFMQFETVYDTDIVDFEEFKHNFNELFVDAIVAYEITKKEFYFINQWNRQKVDNFWLAISLDFEERIFQKNEDLPRLLNTFEKKTNDVYKITYVLYHHLKNGVNIELLKLIAEKCEFNVTKINSDIELIKLYSFFILLSDLKIFQEIAELDIPLRKIDPLLSFVQEFYQKFILDNNSSMTKKEYDEFVKKLKHVSLIPDDFSITFNYLHLNVFRGSYKSGLKTLNGIKDLNKVLEIDSLFTGEEELVILGIEILIRGIELNANDTDRIKDVVYKLRKISKNQFVNNEYEKPKISITSHPAVKKYAISEIFH